MTERPKLSLERTFEASLDEVWEMWTTKEGIESWWGPEGFSVAVSDLDLRPGGHLAYTMSATAPEQMEYMVKAGMPLTTEHRLTFTEIDPPRRLAYRDIVDFIPDVPHEDGADLRRDARRPVDAAGQDGPRERARSPRETPKSPTI